jgi:Glycosyl transferase family 2
MPKNHRLVQRLPSASDPLPCVRIVVPCYGYADVLEGCVTSLLTQDAVDVRVLIIDDCSPDQTPLVAERLAKRDARVEYRRHGANQGLIRTANEGLDWAAQDSDYTALISADDQLVPGSLRRATSVMEARPEIGMVYGWALYARAGRPMPSQWGRWIGVKRWKGRDWIGLRCRSGHNCISSPEVLVRTTVQTRAGRYDPECRHSSDLNMWLRIAAMSDIAHIRGAAQAIYRVHSDSMSRSDPSMLLSLRERRKAFESFFARSSLPPAETDRLRDMAGRALAKQALWRASRTVDQNSAEPPDSVDDLIAFATEVCPDVTRLREWSGLRIRQRIGAGRSRLFIPFLATGAAHRAHHHLAQLQLRTLGR